MTNYDTASEHMITQNNMNRLASSVRPLLLGLMIAQVIATVQVYLANVDLYRTLVAIKDGGYLVIPNQTIMPSLRAFGSAFWGGLFFTLSVGAALSLLSLGAAWGWDRLFFRKTGFLILFLVLWLGSLVLVNHRGWWLLNSLYFLIIPPAVFVLTVRWMPPVGGEKVWLNRLVHAIPLLLLALLWSAHLNSGLFVDVRDNLLLSNSLGTKINDFYYDYTLYPAEAFKSLEQKSLKTCNLEDIRKKPFLPSLQRALLRYDYLPLQGVPLVDLRISLENDQLAFANGARTVFQTSVKDFFSNPGEALKEFSQRSDRHGFFRSFTFYSLLFGFPVALYIFLYAVLRFVSSFFLGARAAAAVASIFCFFIGVALLLVFLKGRETIIDVSDVAAALKSDHWQERVAALKFIEQQGLEVTAFLAPQGMMQSPHIPERYWLVRALGVSRQPGTYRDLLASLDDPHPNVVSMAFSALGQRGNSTAIPEILTRLESSDNWYNQGYAYRALRALGW
jgi:hypothetical protein